LDRNWGVGYLEYVVPDGDILQVKKNIKGEYASQKNFPDSGLITLWYEAQKWDVDGQTTIKNSIQHSQTPNLYVTR
jgi:hypothetical protein